MTETHPMIDNVASCAARMVKIEGPAASGKTQCLVQRVVCLLQGGANPHSVLVETTTALGAQAFRERLLDALETAGVADAAKAAAEVTIEPAASTCVRVLNTPTARAATGRVPYVLTQAERTFLLEDLKTLGQKNRQMKSMLAHFKANWAAGTPTRKWVAAGEEEFVYETLLSTLTSRGAMLPDEVAFCCLEYLQGEAGHKARHAYTHVLADDFQNLSAAEQTVLCLLAADQVVIAGCVQETLTRRDTLANPQGFTEFDALRHGVEVFTLPARTATAQVQAVKWNTPEDELNGATLHLRKLVDAQGIPANRVCVVVPNARWAKFVKPALAARGFEVDTAAMGADLRGDPRDVRSCRALAAYTKLALLADERNITAWRSICGIGNYLTNSDAWAHLMQWAEAQNLGTYDALCALAEAEDEPFLRAGALQEAFAEGRSFIEANRGRRGFALLSACGADGLPEFEAITATIAGDEDAQTLFALVRCAFLSPQFAEDNAAIRLATPENLAGLSFDVVFIMAAIDGFYPQREAFEVVSTDEARQATLEADRRAFAAATAKAHTHLIANFFTKADLELAERTKMQVTRVRADHGKRIALVRPSMFLEEGPFPAAGTTAGEQLLAAL